MYDFATATIADFAKDNPEHREEARNDIRNIKSGKIGENEAILAKINSTFMVIIRDIKSEDSIKATSPLATKEFMQSVWEQLADKQRETRPFLLPWIYMLMYKQSLNNDLQT